MILPAASPNDPADRRRASRTHIALASIPHHTEPSHPTPTHARPHRSRARSRDWPGLCIGSAESRGDFDNAGQSKPRTPSASSTPS